MFWVFILKFPAWGIPRALFSPAPAPWCKHYLPAVVESDWNRRDGRDDLLYNILHCCSVHRYVCRLSVYPFTLNYIITHVCYIISDNSDIGEKFSEPFVSR